MHPGISSWAVSVVLHGSLSLWQETEIEAACSGGLPRMSISGPSTKAACATKSEWEINMPDQKSLKFRRHLTYHEQLRKSGWQRNRKMKCKKERMKEKKWKKRNYEVSRGKIWMNVYILLGLFKYNMEKQYLNETWLQKLAT